MFTHVYKGVCGFFLSVKFATSLLASHAGGYKIDTFFYLAAVILHFPRFGFVLGPQLDPDSTSGKMTLIRFHFDFQNFAKNCSFLSNGFLMVRRRIIGPRSLLGLVAVCGVGWGRTLYYPFWWVGSIRPNPEDLTNKNRRTKFHDQNTESRGPKNELY